MLLEASQVSFASNQEGFCTPKDAVEVEWLYNFFYQNEDDNLNEISLEDAYVTYFDTGYIGCSICRRRNCTDCKVLLLVDSERQEQIEEYIPKDYIYLFDDANQRMSAITELCYAVTTLAVQAYNAVLLDCEIRIKFLASDKQRCVFPQALLGLSSSSAAVLNKRCSQNHENFALIFQTTFKCFAKNELKSLSCGKSEPPAKM